MINLCKSSFIGAEKDAENFWTRAGPRWQAYTNISTANFWAIDAAKNNSVSGDTMLNSSIVTVNISLVDKIPLTLSNKEGSNSFICAGKKVGNETLTTSP